MNEWIYLFIGGGDHRDFVSAMTYFTKDTHMKQNRGNATDLRHHIKKKTQKKY